MFATTFILDYVDPKYEDSKLHQSADIPVHLNCHNTLLLEPQSLTLRILEKFNT